VTPSPIVTDLTVALTFCVMTMLSVLIATVSVLCGVVLLQLVQVPAVPQLPLAPASAQAKAQAEVADAPTMKSASSPQVTRVIAPCSARSLARRPEAAITLGTGTARPTGGPPHRRALLGGPSFGCRRLAGPSATCTP